MPRRDDIESVMAIGSGGIVIAQAAEFDYSGSQALKALKEEGIKTILVNPNCATIQTSLKMADKVYMEPITPGIVHQIMKREEPDGVLFGFGGQTALNIAVQLDEAGVLEDEDVKVLGSPIETIKITEDRGLFKEAMERANVPIPISEPAYSAGEALEIAKSVGYPVIIRTAYALGGGGSGVAYNPRELKAIVTPALLQSIEHQVLVEQYLEHWKEIEYEVMRDCEDNCITVAALENVDPLGIHTGDSIVVAPTQTITNREYQTLRSASIRIIRSTKVIGECNVQLGLEPTSERYVAIEVNARMSRSSALASKATGYPLAYISAKLAIGYTLPELVNKVTGKTTACFEPALDYVVVKVPRWDFPKFVGASRRIGTQMKSVGEVMAIARSFEEAIQKAVRELEIDKLGLTCNSEDGTPESLSELKRELRYPTDQRLFKIVKAIKAGMSIDKIFRLTGIDRWFLYKIRNIVRMEELLRSASLNDAREDELEDLVRRAKRLGFSDLQIARCFGKDEWWVRKLRKRRGVVPSFKIVDTMAAEWPSKTNYCYVTYGDQEDDVEFATKEKKVIVLGAGPIRIGSSVEFDYCTMNTAWALKEEGIGEVIVVNNNPETVSTDYDMSDKLYFEEITMERILDIIDRERPMGVVVSVGGQTPNNLALRLARCGVKLLGTSAESIDMAEDRSKFSSLLDKLGIPQPPWNKVTLMEDARSFARKVGYPVIVRPSYVLSGAAMRVARSEFELVDYIRRATKLSPEHPVVISKFIEHAKEVEVDAVSDGESVVLGAIIEHIELAGTHSGDATMVIPAQTLTKETKSTIEDYARRLGRALRIQGPFNIQFVVKDKRVYVIELNLRASRSMPYTSKSTGIPLIWLSAKAMLGRKLNIFGEFLEAPATPFVSVKAPTFSFVRIKEADPLLGVEMNSTGEVACLDRDFAQAYVKALIASGFDVPKPGEPILIMVRDEDKPLAVAFAKRLRRLGHPIYATRGTARALRKAGIKDVKMLAKIRSKRENVLDYISGRKVGLVINTPSSRMGTIRDGFILRRTAIEFLIPTITRMETADALARALSEGPIKMVPYSLEGIVGSRPI